MGLADTQLVTAFALFASGYYALSCGLSAYHWQIIVWLGWFASITHLSSLTSMRTYLYTHKAERAVRMTLLTVLLVFLLVAVVPTGHFEFDYDHSAEPSRLYDGSVRLDVGDRIIPGTRYDTSTLVSWASPAVCFLKGGWERDRVSFTSMVYFVVLLLYSYVVRVSRLFQRTSIGLKSTIQSSLEGGHRQILDAWQSYLRTLRPETGLLIGAICVPMQTGLYFSLRMMLDIYSSMFVEVCPFPDGREGNKELTSGDR